MTTFNVLGTALAVSLLAAPVVANEFSADLNALAQGEIQSWAASPEVIAAVKAQNGDHAGMSQEQIDALDQTWRAETSTGGDLIDTVMAAPVSDYLRGLREGGQGMYTEIFIMDSVGLNVGQSDITSDFWQGDEAKWQVPFGSSETHISEVEFDESSQSFQSQISVPIFDPETSEPIGAMTVGVNVELLAQLN